MTHTGIIYNTRSIISYVCLEKINEKKYKKRMYESEENETNKHCMIMAPDKRSSPV